MKRSILLMLVAAFILTAISVFSVPSFALDEYEEQKKYKKQNVYEGGKLVRDPTWGVSSEAELYIVDESDFLSYAHKLKESASSENNFVGKVIHIVNDLDLSNIENWYEYLSYGKRFSGIIDGHGHTLSGLNYVRTGTSYRHQGLLGGRISPQSDGYNEKYDAYAGVFNLVIEDSSMSVQAFSAGSLFGSVQNSVDDGSVVFENVYADVDITSSSYSVGGFIGSVYGNAEIRNCVFAGNITSSYAKANSSVGGFVGRVNDSASYQGHVKITASAFYGNINSSTGISGFGSFVGEFYGSGGSADIRYCIQGGSVELSASTESVGMLVGAVVSDATLRVADVLICGSVTVNGLSVRDICGNDGSVSADNFKYVSSDSLKGYDAELCIDGVDLRLYFTPSASEFAMPTGVFNFITEERTGKYGTRYAGYQTTEFKDGYADVRIVGVTDSLEYGAVGFEVILSTESRYRIWSNSGEISTVYSSIEGGGNTYTSSELGGYIFTVKCMGIKQNVGKVTFTVKTFHRGISSDTRIYDDVYVICVDTGNVLKENEQ